VQDCGGWTGLATLEFDLVGADNRLAAESLPRRPDRLVTASNNGVPNPEVQLVTPVSI
jgi:hypothetical protein